MISLCTPELVLIIIFIYHTEHIYVVPEILAITLTISLLLIRPIIFYIFRKKTFIKSIWLPSSVATDVRIIKPSAKIRMDSDATESILSKT